jgi:secreted trypsin-like serine protease
VVNGCGSLGDPAVMFSYSQPTAGTCNGDSGGPASIIRNDTPYVAGMTSFGDRDRVIYGVSSRADAFESHIQDFTGVTPLHQCCVSLMIYVTRAAQMTQTVKVSEARPPLAS